MEPLPQHLSPVAAWRLAPPSCLSGVCFFVYLFDYIVLDSLPGRCPALIPLCLQAPTSLQWYLEVYPQLPPEQRPLEVVQQAGDTLFLPAGALVRAHSLLPSAAASSAVAVMAVEICCLYAA